MRSMRMIVCSGLAGSIVLGCLMAPPIAAQQRNENAPIELQFNPDTTSRRPTLDLFNLQQPQPAVQTPTQPYYTTAPQRAVALSAAPVAEANPFTEAARWNANLAAGMSSQDPVDDAEDGEEGDEEFELGGAGRSLSPDQSRPLNTGVASVNITTVDVGTGVLPDGATRTLAGSRLLPTGLERGAQFVCVHWQPSLVCHYPLYFEDAMLERHGQVRWGHLQSFASGVKFYSTLPLLPYLRTLRPKHECIYQVGHYRAGSAAPVLKDHIPYDRNAAVVEGLYLAGFFWAMPL
jgi:hypothetical protein